MSSALVRSINVRFEVQYFSVASEMIPETDDEKGLILLHPSVLFAVVELVSITK